ncbi:META domain-containing protein [Novosphingobium profundi]|uniref:META domain-containing protein n=1 Tax=Novosphingobium profundi TaxID=1774954 RepID=UPI001CFE7632|nr:META domain-containing protein [Novosphingobium profundi]
MIARTPLRRSACIALLLATTSACASLDAREERQSALIGPTWQLAGIAEGGSQTTLTAQQSQELTLTFNVKGEAHFRLACNTGNARWTAQFMEGRIQITPIATTRKLCPDPEIANRVGRELPGDRRYRFSPDEKTMFIQSDTVTFRFVDSAD